MQQAMAGFSLGKVKQEQVEAVNEISNVVDLRDHKKLEDTQTVGNLIFKLVITDTYKKWCTIVVKFRTAVLKMVSVENHRN